MISVPSWLLECRNFLWESACWWASPRTSRTRPRFDFVGIVLVVNLHPWEVILAVWMFWMRGLYIALTDIAMRIWWLGSVLFGGFLWRWRTWAAFKDAWQDRAQPWHTVQPCAQHFGLCRLCVPNLVLKHNHVNQAMYILEEPFQYIDPTFRYL